MNKTLKREYVKKAPIIAILLVLLFPCTSHAQDLAWTQAAGPLRVGKATSFAVLGDVWYASTVMGLFQSGDAGASWSQVSTGFRDVRISDILVDPQQRLFLATATHQILRSSDGGATWVRLDHGLPGDNPVYALTHDAGGRLYAAVGPARHFPDHYDNQGIYLSDDGGDSWRDSGLRCGRENSISPGGMLYVACSQSVHRSADRGVTWTSIGDALEGRYVSSVIAGPDSLVYVGTFYACSGHTGCAPPGGFFRSEDGGRHWRQYAAGLTDSTIQDLALLGERLLFAATPSGVFRSEDAGLTWRLTDLRDVDVSWLTQPADGALVAGTEAGIFRSDDFGATWHGVARGFPAHWINVLLTHGDTLYAAANSVYRSTDGGETWDDVGLHRTAVALAVDSQGVLYAATQLQGLFRLSGRDTTWAPVGDGLPDVYLHALAILPGDVLMVGMDRGLFRSSDGGASWHDVTHGIEPNPGENLSSVHDLLHDGKHLFAAAASGLYRAVDGAEGWERVFEEGGGVLAADPAGVLYYRGVEIVYRSENGGATWDPTGLRLQRSEGLYAIRTLLAPREKMVLAGTSLGVYQSTDGGESWTLENAGLHTSTVYALAADRHGFVYAGTGGGSVYRSLQPLRLGREDPSPTPEPLLTHFPNPVRTTATVRYTLDRPQHVTLRVYNLLGQEVMTVVDAHQPAGVQEAVFDAGGLSSGTYVYRLSMEDRVHAGRLVVLR